MTSWYGLLEQVSEMMISYACAYARAEEMIELLQHSNLEDRHIPHLPALKICIWI